MSTPSFPWRFAAAAFFVVARLSAQSIQPDAALSPDEEASRFLAQATFGPTTDAIAELRGLGNNFSAWIDREIAKPATLSAPLVTSAVSAGVIPNIQNPYNRRARTQVMISGDDQLRQRVAYALSQIFVISDNTSAVGDFAESTCSYYDMLAQDSFGSFRQLLLDVTRHPAMGRYLTHYKNRKANLTSGTRPDENYAREAMQLFTLGVYLLNQDGSVQTSGGRPLDAYTNDQITEFARVYTGFTDEDNNPAAVGTGTGREDFPRATRNPTQPMKMWELQHDTGSKSLLSYPGVRKAMLPAGQAGLQDVNDAVDNLVEHPNTAPFISRQLIQRLVTSNPSGAYVRRVANVFVNNGRGERGDLAAVIRAILLDDEARNADRITGASQGKLREPFLRITHLLRAFRYKISGSTLAYDFRGAIGEGSLGQFPLAAPSVFNFYQPDYEPPGPLTDANLVAPEFQILTSLSATTTTNNIYSLIHDASVGNFSLNLSEQGSLAAASTGALLDNLDLLMTHGTLSNATRAKITTALDSITASMVPSGSTLGMTKARLGLYLVAISPDYAVLK